jgi:hypothetical protein
MTTIQNLTFALRKLGVAGTLRLVAEKRAKKNRLSKLIHHPFGTASIIAVPNMTIELTDEEKNTLIDRADEMLHDENYVFTFLHHLKDIPDVWNYDPLEKKYWPKKQYEETNVHSGDVASDVKIVWEVNRFKYLPLLAQAAYITKDKKYADEIESRIVSWIEGNPFAGSINWSSPLEIAIRGISWAASLRILALAGFDISRNKNISQSIWQHAAYLNAELSTDKIVRSNHLIGETAGLYILSTLFDFPEAVFYKLRAKKILSDSILKQTYSDGASRESSGWYHTFVTDFADLALRTARSTGDMFDSSFTERFHQMSIYRNSIILPDGDAVKFGDIDFGKAINLPGQWKDLVFGENAYKVAERKNYFPTAGQITALIERNYLFVRAGDFGWGGNGFSSHAHDDFLAPIVAMDGANILVDPGTFAYNGSPETRDRERGAEMHNGLIIKLPNAQTPEVRRSFGWLKTRPASSILTFEEQGNKIFAQATYGEMIGKHERSFTLTTDSFTLEDDLHFNSDSLLEWNFHFHPRWRIEKISASKIALHDFRDNHYECELIGTGGELEISSYEFYPAYRQKSKAWKIRIQGKMAGGEKRVVRFSVGRAQSNNKGEGE